MIFCNFLKFYDFSEILTHFRDSPDFSEISRNTMKLNSLLNPHNSWSHFSKIHPGQPQKYELQTHN